MMNSPSTWVAQYRQQRNLIQEAFGPSPGDARSLEPCGTDNQVRSTVLDLFDRGIASDLPEEFEERALPRAQLDVPDADLRALERRSGHHQRQGQPQFPRHGDRGCQQGPTSLHRDGARTVPPAP